MASSSKKKTTFAKMNRENAVREKRMIKQARKDARKLAAAEPQPEPSDDEVTGDEPVAGDEAVTEARPVTAL
jgi:hypothetical protein